MRRCQPRVCNKVQGVCQPQQPWRCQGAAVPLLRQQRQVWVRWQRQGHATQDRWRCNVGQQRSVGRVQGRPSWCALTAACWGHVSCVCEVAVCRGATCNRARDDALRAARRASVSCVLFVTPPRTGATATSYGGYSKAVESMGAAVKKGLYSVHATCAHHAQRPRCALHAEPCERRRGTPAPRTLVKRAACLHDHLRRSDELMHYTDYKPWRRAQHAGACVTGDDCLTWYLHPFAHAPRAWLLPHPLTLPQRTHTQCIDTRFTPTCARELTLCPHGALQPSAVTTANLRQQQRTWGLGTWPLVPSYQLLQLSSAHVAMAAAKGSPGAPAKQADFDALYKSLLQHQEETKRELGTLASGSRT